MNQSDDMRYETYQKDKEIKETTLEIQNNVEDIKNKVDKGNKKLKNINEEVDM